MAPKKKDDAKQVLAIRVTPSLRASLKQAAQKAEVSVSEFITEAVEERLAAQ